MSEKATGITVDAVALQERDDFDPRGWVKAIAPAKVNLHLAIGSRRPDGYHDVATVMHALNLHDVLYLRRKLPDASDFVSGKPAIRMVAAGDAPVPNVPTEHNLVYKAIMRLADALHLPPEQTDLEVRIEKCIPAEGGLGGGSSDAAAALVAAACLWGLPVGNPSVDGPLATNFTRCCLEVAQSLGADVSFFLQGGCAYYEGMGATFVRSLIPSKQPIALVKPPAGVSTAEAYRTFDQQQEALQSSQPPKPACNVRSAAQVKLYNNLAPAAETLLPALADIRQWLAAQPGVQGVLLCGSGGTTFALCDDSAAARTVVTQARKHGWWARSTSLGSVRATALSDTGSAASFAALSETAPATPAPASSGASPATPAPASSGAAPEPPAAAPTSAPCAEGAL